MKYEKLGIWYVLTLLVLQTLIMSGRDFVFVVFCFCFLNSREPMAFHEWKYKFKAFLENSCI